MAGQPGAGLLIGRVGGDAAGIADRRHPDAFGLPEQALGAPEAAEAEHSRLQPVGIGTLERPLRDEMLGRGRDGTVAAGQRLAGLRQIELLVQHVAQEEHGFSLVRSAGHAEFRPDGRRADAPLRPAADRVEQEGQHREHHEARLFQDEEVIGSHTAGWSPVRLPCAASSVAGDSGDPAGVERRQHHSPRQSCASHPAPP